MQMRMIERAFGISWIHILWWLAKKFDPFATAKENIHVEKKNYFEKKDSVTIYYSWSIRIWTVLQWKPAIHSPGSFWQKQTTRKKLHSWTMRMFWSGMDATRIQIMLLIDIGIWSAILCLLRVLSMRLIFYNCLMCFQPSLPPWGHSSIDR